MATIMSLFSRRNTAEALAGAESVADGDAPRLGISVGTPLHTKDLAAFERLGESQQSIDFALGTVQQGLSGLHALVEHVSALKAEVARSFEDHRKLALANSAVSQDRDHIQQRLIEKSEQYDSTHAELLALRSEADDIRRNYERARTDLEALEHRHHLLSVAKRETEDQLTRAVGQLSAANEDAESLRLEVSSLQEMVDSYTVRIGELTGKYNEANNKAVLLSNRCEALESSLQQKVDELIAVNERFDLVYQEKESAVLYSQQKEQEAVHARAEMTRIFQQTQQEKKARELSINQLKADLDSARAHVKMLEEVNSEAVAENERMVANTRRLDDLVKQSEVNLGRLETKVVRLNAKLESTVNAKAQLEQSRATMAARLEAVTQTLCDRESDVKRLEGEVTRLTTHVEKQGAIAQDTIESLGARVFELEKELSAQRNETAFYASQLEASQRTDSRITQG